MDGVTRKLLRKESTIPTSVDWPVKDWKTWLKVKEERVNAKNVSNRFPSIRRQLVKEYRNRDYPLAVGGYPHGFFGLPAHLMG